MSPENLQDDEVRLCPICRSPISVWATKCKHCGAEVGRPRVEESKLTLKDLGGEAQNTYTVSGNVKDALESFRAEELSAQEEEYRQQDEVKKSWFGKRKAKAAPAKDMSDSEHILPELDNYHKELAEGMQEITTLQKRDAARRARQQPAISRTIFIAAAVMAGLVLLYLGGSFAVPRIKEYFLAKNKKHTPICDAGDAQILLNQGANTIRALEAAMEAVNCDATEENTGIAADVRGRFTKEMNDGLSADSYDELEMTRISGWIERAGLADKDNNDINILLDRVRADLRDYGLILDQIDLENKRAKFQLIAKNAAGEVEVWVERGELISGRFRVTRIRSDGVFFEDIKIKKRPLVSKIHTKVVAE